MYPVALAKTKDLNRLCQKISPTIVSSYFIGSLSRTETMRQVLEFKCKFPNYFAFTPGP
jgi:hypothetical protein